VSLSLSLSAALMLDCGDTSAVASSSSFSFFVLGPHGLLLGRLHFARKSLHGRRQQSLYLINLTLTFPRTKWFAPECAKLLNWFANTRKSKWR